MAVEEVIDVPYTDEWTPTGVISQVFCCGQRDLIRPSGTFSMLRTEKGQLVRCAPLSLLQRKLEKVPQRGG